MKNILSAIWQFASYLFWPQLHYKPMENDHTSLYEDTKRLVAITKQPAALRLKNEVL